MADFEDARTSRTADALMHLAHAIKSVEKFLRDSESDAEHREVRHSAEHTEIRRMLSELLTLGARILDRVGDQQSAIGTVKKAAESVEIKLDWMREDSKENRIIPKHKTPPRGVTITVDHVAKAWPVIKSGLAWLFAALGLAGAGTAIGKLISWMRGHQ